jgi:hypothetical protein
MSLERRDQLIHEICVLRDVPGADEVLARGVLDIDSFDVAIDHFEEDGDAVYVTFQYGVVTAGRTLRVFRLLLEANLAVYAQDQAQLGLEVATGAIVLIARVALNDEVDGKWLLAMIEHYVEHGRYWRDNIFKARDDMFENLARGDYVWLRA